MRTLKVLALVLLTALAFNACSSDKDDEHGVNPLEKDYFTIENASFVGNDLQGGEEDLIESLLVNKTVINGGSTALYITSPTELQSVRVAVKGVKGYYDYPLPKAVTPKSVKAGLYEYEVVILLSQALAAKNIVFSLVAIATDGLIGEIVDSNNIEVIAAGTGELQVSLSWDQLDDVDLHLFDADGNEVYYGNRYVTVPGGAHKDASGYTFLRLKLMEETDYPVEALDPYNETDISKLLGFAVNAGINVNGSAFQLEYNNYLAENAVKFGIIGLLDIDSNADCRVIDGVNNENITYSSLKDGVYTIEVKLYKKCNYSVAYPKYMATVIHKGKHIKLSSRHRGQFGNYVSRVVIGSFTISGGTLTVKPVDETQSSFNMEQTVVEKEAYSVF